MTGNRSPFLRGGRASNAKLGSEPLDLDTDISFISSERPSSDRMSNVVYEYMDSGPTPRISSSSDHSFGSIRIGPAFGDPNSLNFSSISQESGRTSCSSTSMVSTHQPPTCTLIHTWAHILRAWNYYPLRCFTYHHVYYNKARFIKIKNKKLERHIFIFVICTKTFHRNNNKNLRPVPLKTFATIWKTNS